MSGISRLAFVTIAATVGVAGLGTPSLADAGPASSTGRLVIVQAVPRDSLDVMVDGHAIRKDAAVGAVLGPVAVSAGRHEVRFSDASGRVRLTSTVEVTPGSSSDIVVHLPAQLHGAPVVNAYRTPRAPIAPGKARVLIAHTATVAPADVRVDGTVVFRDIANGEYATADVAAGAHSVALLPTGVTSKPILGPLHVDLKAGTVTMVYAVGTPRDGSMNVITHTAALGSNGAVVPKSIDTGQAGLAAGWAVHPFHASASRAEAAEQAGAPRVRTWWLTIVGGVLLGSATLPALRRRVALPRRSG